ncbi:DUF916 and DUF3324 domain-containing protein [Lapidilactobacillus wuchangensis]|uniref:DUF916 and DUF3324 domain-containing protein n=1 Tax=Lapidilactobacillus wuchangensis TaxID=2486001 RepID=UPI000F7B1295|nr:DUF916 and DUF3324 domain-containing protein [Lapidilactobacillus wuchangensis]
MKFKIILGAIIVAGLVSLGLIAPRISQAAETGAEFSVQPILPAAQTDQQLHHFAITPQANTTYPLKIVVENLSPTTSHQFRVQLLAATTTSGGKIDYTPSNKKRDSSAHVLLPDLVAQQAPEQLITVAPASQEVVTFMIKTPQPLIEGTILGSVYVQRVTELAAADREIGLQNQFAMTIPVVLETPSNRLPKLAVDDVYLASAGGRAGLVAAVHNNSPVMFGQIKLDAKIRRQGQNQVLIHQQDHDYEMAPNSTLDYHLETGSKTLTPGRYVLDLTLNSGQKKFKLQRKFTIKATDQGAVEQHLVEINQTRPTPWLLLILGTLAGLLVISGLIIWFVRQRRRS